MILQPEFADKKLTNPIFENLLSKDIKIAFGENLSTNGVHCRYNAVPASKAFSGIVMVVSSDCDLPDKNHC